MPDCCTFSDDYIVTVDNGSRVDNTVVVQLVIGAMTHVLSLSEVRSLKDLILVLCIRVSAEECGAEQTSVNARLVANDTISLVIARVASDSDNGVAASG